MDDQSGGASGPSLTVRHEPVQARAAQRVEALLDAAAAVVAEHGIEQLTTALVAERAGASIGTVYRYFPDRVAVLVALAERNHERMRHAVGRALARPTDTWREAAEALVETLVETFRELPSYRSLRTGDGLDLGTQPREQLAPQLAAALEAGARERWGVELDAAGRDELETALGALDALVTYAFLHDADGDPRYLALARECALRQLATTLGEPAPGGRDGAG